jgi:predicted PurR-regulated permease PerM
LWFFRVWTLIGLAILILGFLWLMREPLHLIVPPIALAGVLVYLLNPIVTWFERRRLHRVFGTAVTYVVVLAVVVGLAWLVLPILARQTADLVQRLPDIAVTVQDVVNRQLARLDIGQRIVLDPDNADVGQAINDFLRDNRDQLLGLLRGAGSIVASVIALLVTLILAPVLAFYVLADLPRLSDGVRRLVPPDSRSEFVDVSQRILTTVGAYFRGQLLVALFVGVATAVGLGVIGLPFWAIVGATAGAFNLVPFIGPFVGGAIGVVVALTVGSGFSQAIVVVIVMTAVQQVDNHVVTPNILSRTVHVHPVTIILALAVAASLFGILGMLVAIPTVAAAKLVIMYVLVTRFPSMAHLAGEGPAIIDGVPVGDPRETSLVSMGNELRKAWEVRRRRRQESEDHSPPER